MKGQKVRLVAVEPSACPTLTEGEYRYDYCDAAGFTPLIKMYTLGYRFTPPGIHAGDCATMEQLLLSAVCFTMD